MLRKEYIAEWRQGAIQVLENTWVQTPDGKKRKLTELKKKEKGGGGGGGGALRSES